MVITVMMNKTVSVTLLTPVVSVGNIVLYVILKWNVGTRLKVDRKSFYTYTVLLLNPLTTISLTPVLAHCYIYKILCF